MQYLTHEEVRAFFKAAREDRLEAFYVLAVTTELRQGELLVLKWEDVDFEAGKISVQRTLSAARNGPIFNSPKRSKSRRSVKLAALALETLRSHRERQSQELEKLDGLWQEHGLVFASTLGTPPQPPQRLWPLLQALPQQGRSPPHYPLPRPQAHLRDLTLLEEHQPKGDPGGARPR